MNLETRTLADGRLHRHAFAMLPASGRVPVDLSALDAPGWAAQSAAWLKDDPADVAALFDAAVAATTFAPDIEPAPVHVPQDPMVLWRVQMRRLDMALTNDARYWEELALGTLSPAAIARMAAIIAKRAAHRAVRPNGI